MSVPKDHVAALMDLGFSEAKATRALAHTSGNIDHAVQFLVDDSEQLEPFQPEPQTTTLWTALAAFQENDERTFSSASRVLLRVLDNVISDPLEARFRTLRLDNPCVKQHLVPAKGAITALVAVGWKERYSTKDGSVLVLPSDADPEALLELRDSLQAAAVSRGLPIHSEQPARKSAPATPEESRGSTSDERDDEFVRDEFEEVGADQVAAINSFCRGNETQFIDDQFPPINRSLYSREELATQWECMQCRRFNDLPSQPMRNGFGAPPQLHCAACGAPAPRIALQARPSSWLRPCDLRDDVTMQVGGAPWVVFREDPRSDDVRQGALGNCWFVGALSVVAEQPQLIRRIFLSTDGDAANPNGVYQLRLCRAGVWRTVLVDDLLPCTPHGLLAYSKAARRQLWVPLVEKAAAKLFHSYDNLASGTMSEAFTLFTGFPSEQINLGGLGEFGVSGERDGAMVDQEVARAAAAADVAEVDADAVWRRVLDAKAAGFLMGSACQGRADHSHREKGLQAPHAYAVLDVRDVHGFRLVKLRNPWGQHSWNGDWSLQSQMWRDFPHIAQVHPHCKS